MASDLAFLLHDPSVLGPAHRHQRPISKMITLKHLPPELIRIIASHCIDRNHIYRATSSRSSQAAFAATCRQFYDMVNPVLYSSNLRDDQHEDSCIMWAAREGKPDTIKRALLFGANLDENGDRGVKLDMKNPWDDYNYVTNRSLTRSTPLHVAVCHGHREVVEVLLQNGASPHIPSRRYCRCRLDCEEAYAFHMALGNNYSSNMIETLVKLGNAFWELPGKSVLRALLAKDRQDLVDHIFSITSAEISTLALCHSVEHGNMDLFDRSMAQPLVDVNFRETGNYGLYEMAPLEMAIFRNRKDMARRLLAHPDIKPAWKALSICSEVGDLEILKALLARAGLNPNVSDPKTERPLLYSAARQGRLDVFKYLIQNYPSMIGPTTNCSETVLHAALQGRNIDIVRMLLDRPDTDAGSHDHAGETPLIAAIQSKFSEAVDLLLQRRDVDPTIGEWNREELERVAPMYCAAAYGNVEVMKQMLAHPKIHADAKDVFGRTVLHYAALGVSKGFIMEDTIFHYLLEQDGVHCRDEDLDGYNVLHFISAQYMDDRDDPRTGNVGRSMSKFFVDQGVPLNKNTPLGTPFYISIKNSHGDLRTAAFLLDLGADPLIAPTPQGGMTPLHHALVERAHKGLERQQVQVVAALLTAKPDLESYSHSEDLSSAASNWSNPCAELDISGPPLTFATLRAESDDCTKLLLDAGAFPGAHLDLDFHDPLSWGTSFGVLGGGISISIIGGLLRTDDVRGFIRDEQITPAVVTTMKLLLSYGSYIDTGDNIDLTPLYAACMSGIYAHFVLLELLLEQATAANCSDYRTLYKIIDMVKESARTRRGDLARVLQMVNDFMDKEFPNHKEDKRKDDMAREDFRRAIAYHEPYMCMYV